MMGLQGRINRAIARGFNIPEQPLTHQVAGQIYKKVIDHINDPTNRVEVEGLLNPKMFKVLDLE